MLEFGREIMDCPFAVVPHSSRNIEKIDICVQTNGRTLERGRLDWSFKAIPSRAVFFQQGGGSVANSLRCQWSRFSDHRQLANLRRVSGHGSKDTRHHDDNSPLRTKYMSCAACQGPKDIKRMERRCNATLSFKIFIQSYCRGTETCSCYVIPIARDSAR